MVCRWNSCLPTAPPPPPPPLSLTWGCQQLVSFKSVVFPRKNRDRRFFLRSRTGQHCSTPRPAKKPSYIKRCNSPSHLGNRSKTQNLEKKTSSCVKKSQPTGLKNHPSALNLWKIFFLRLGRALSIHIYQVVCQTMALTFTLKSTFRRKKNYGNSNISPCKNIIIKKIL